MPKFLTRQSKGVATDSNGDYSINGTISGFDFKLDVGAHCNLLLTMAEDYDEMPDSESKAKADALRAIVARVAEFESLENEPEL